MDFPINTHNRRQRVARLEREIAGFQETIDRIGVPATPQQRQAATLASRCLARRNRDLSAVMARPAC